MTMREKLIARVWECGYPDFPLDPDQTDEMGANWAEEIVDAILAELREPIIEWLDYQIEHGHAPDGHPVEMAPLFREGRYSAHCGARAMIERVFADHSKSAQNNT